MRLFVLIFRTNGRFLIFKRVNLMKHIDIIDIFSKKELIGQRVTV